MFSTQRIIATSLALLSLATPSQTAPASSTFVLPTNGGKNLTFALNVPADSEDLYFYLSGPASNSYIAIGTGDEMQDSLMILVYQSQHGNNITVSPRLCSGHVEPVYEPSLDVDILPGSGIFHDTYVLNARCENCRHWKTGSLDLKSTEQSWIYALGPGVTMRSDSKTISIERHSEYGKFKVNMLQATGAAGVPTLTTKTSGAAEEGAPTHDSNWPSIIHAVVMSLSFILMMPLGVIFLRILERVRWHWVNQSLAMGVAIVGTGLGLYLASMFNKSKNYSSTHQILGLVVSAFLLVQFFLGYWHHRLYRATQKTTVYVTIHHYLGQIVILGGVINGGIGLTFSRASTGVIIGYSITVIVVAILAIGPVSWKRFRNSRSPGYKRRSIRGQGLSVDGPWDSSRSQSDINLARYAQVPGVSQDGPTAAVPYADRDRVQEATASGNGELH